jgi:hypothetical protein
VPLALGADRTCTEVVSTTFYVVDSDEYHWILGLPLLAAVRGKVLCAERVLEYTVASGATRKLGLISRSQVREQPVRATFRNKLPLLEAEQVQLSNWQEAILHTDEVEYVGEGLACILGR